MEIKIKELVACSKCHRLKGEVFEKYNGIVPVLCICDLKEGKHGIVNTSIIGGIIPSGKIHIMWTPTCNHLDENGNPGMSPLRRFWMGFG